MSIGQGEDDRAFGEWLRAFYIQHPKFPEELMKSGHEGSRQTWLMRRAFDAGMERGQEKRGCCSESPGANAGCCPDSVGRDAN